MQMATAALAKDSVIGSPRYRWYALAVLFLVSTLNTVDKTLIPALAEPLKIAFELSDTQLGFLAGMVFAVAYTIGGIPIGLLIDRVHRCRLLACLVAVWSGATLVGGFASSFLALAMARVVVASAESGGNPTSMSLISDYFPREQRGTALGIFQASSAVGVFLVFAVGGYVAATYGWQYAFFLAGTPGVLLACLVFFTLKEPKRGTFDPSSQEDSGPRPSFGVIIKSMVSNKILLFIVIGATLNIVGQAGMSGFTAAFLVRVHELTITQAGVVSGSLFGLSVLIGTIGGGIVTDRISKKSRSAGCFLVAAVIVVGVPLAIIGFTTSNVVMALGFLFVSKIFLTSFFGATFVTVLDVAPVSMRGVTAAYTILIMNFGGFGLGPQITGILSDTFLRAGVPDPLRWALVCASLIFLISGVFYFLAGHRLQRSV